MFIIQEDQEWREKAKFQPIPGLPGHMVERVVSTKAFFHSDELEYQHIGYLIYECISEVHGALGEHGDWGECSWVPLMNNDGNPWRFVSVGQVNTAIERIRGAEVARSAQPSD